MQPLTKKEFFKCVNDSIFFVRLLFTGVADTINLLRSKYGIKIGSSTGYTKEIMAMLKVFFTTHRKDVL